MTIIDFYPIFADSTASLKETSKDDSDIQCIQYMTESSIEVIDFDLVKRRYANALGLSEEVVKSVDAIMQVEDHIAFIEFKNGKVNNRNVKDKVRDTLLIFSDVTGVSITYTRDNVDLYVVYNLDANPLPNQYMREVMQEAPSRIAIGDYFAAKAKTEIIRFDLERYKKIYFRDVHTYPIKRFEELLQN